MEHVEREVGHAGGEAEARGGAGGAGEVRLAAAVAAPAQGASQQWRCCEEEEEEGEEEDGQVNTTQVRQKAKGPEGPATQRTHEEET